MSNLSIKLFLGFVGLSCVAGCDAVHSRNSNADRKHQDKLWNDWQQLETTKEKRDSLPSVSRPDFELTFALSDKRAPRGTLLDWHFNPYYSEKKTIQLADQTFLANIHSFESLDCAKFDWMLSAND